MSARPNQGKSPERSAAVKTSWQDPAIRQQRTDNMRATANSKSADRSEAIHRHITIAVHVGQIPRDRIEVELFGAG